MCIHNPWEVCASSQAWSRSAQLFSLEIGPAMSFVSIWQKHLRLSRQKGRKYLHISSSITARNYLRDLSASQKVWSQWLGVTAEKLSLLLSFTSFLRLTGQQVPSSDHTSPTQHLFCKKFERELWKEEFLWCLTIGKLCQIFYTSLCRDQLREMWGSHSNCRWWEWVWLGRNKVVLLKSQGTSLEMPSFLTKSVYHNSIQHFWLLRLRFIVLTVWLEGSDPFWGMERSWFPSSGIL